MARKTVIRYEILGKTVGSIDFGPIWLLLHLKMYGLDHESGWLWVYCEYCAGGDLHRVFPTGNTKISRVLYLAALFSPNCRNVRARS